MAKKERTIDDINADVQAAVEAYADAVQSKPAHEADAFAKAIKDLRIEQSACISAGAKACDCGKEPMGMIKSPAYFDSGQGMERPPIYEVGCIFCPQYLVDVDGEKRRRSVAARGFSPEDAVAKWNAGDWVVDTKFEYEPADARVGGLTYGRKIAQFADDGSLIGFDSE